VRGDVTSLLAVIARLLGVYVAIHLGNALRNSTGW
jgi:hypothetical protein